MEEGGLAAALEWWRAEFIDAEMTVARREVAAECGYRWTRPRTAEGATLRLAVGVHSARGRARSPSLTVARSAAQDRNHRMINSCTREHHAKRCQMRIPSCDRAYA
jgi:hypothetical protein